MKFLVERPRHYRERRKDRAGICVGKCTILCVGVKWSEFYKEGTKFVSRVSILEGSRLYESCVQHGILLS